MGWLRTNIVPHIARTALFLWAVTFLLHEEGAEWIDAVALTVQHPYFLEVTKEVSDYRIPSELRKFWGRQQECSREQPLWILIGDLFHEEEFNSTSPIDRKRFLTLLQTIDRMYPELEVLALDYDLSPNYAWDTCNKSRDGCPLELQKHQDELNTYIENLAEMKTVILLEPWAESDIVKDRKGRWKRGLEDHKVRFASPNLLHHKFLSSVTRYEDPGYQFVSHGNSVVSGLFSASMLPK